MHGSLGPIRKNEIESRLLRGLPVNATALAKEFLVSEDAGYVNGTVLTVDGGRTETF